MVSFNVSILFETPPVLFVSKMTDKKIPRFWGKPRNKTEKLSYEVYISKSTYFIKRFVLY